MGGQLEESLEERDTGAVRAARGDVEPPQANRPELRRWAPRPVLYHKVCLAAAGDSESLSLLAHLLGGEPSVSQLGAGHPPLHLSLPGSWGRGGGQVAEGRGWDRRADTHWPLHWLGVCVGSERGQTG